MQILTLVFYVKSFVNTYLFDFVWQIVILVSSKINIYYSFVNVLSTNSIITLIW